MNEQKKEPAKPSQSSLRKGMKEAARLAWRLTPSDSLMLGNADFDWAAACKDAQVRVGDAEKLLSKKSMPIEMPRRILTAEVLGWRAKADCILTNDPTSVLAPDIAQILRLANELEIYLKVPLNPEIYKIALCAFLFGWLDGHISLTASLGQLESGRRFRHGLTPQGKRTIQRLAQKRAVESANAIRAAATKNPLLRGGKKTQYDIEIADGVSATLGRRVSPRLVAAVLKKSHVGTPESLHKTRAHSVEGPNG